MNQHRFTTEDLVVLWDKRKQGDSFATIAKTLWATPEATRRAHEILGYFVRGYRGDRKNRKYAEAARRIRIHVHAVPMQQHMIAFDEMEKQIKLKIADEAIAQDMEPEWKKVKRGLRIALHALWNIVHGVQ